MTLARDPLVVVEALRKALKGWTDYFDRLQQDALLADPNDPLIAMRDKLHGKRMNDSFDALALSAPMPAPETKPPVALCGCVAGGNKCHYHNKHPQIPVSYAPAPERPSVEECPYKVDQQVDCYCVIGPTLHTYGPWPHDALGAAQAVGFADTLNAAYQAGRRAIGGGE